MLSRSAALSVAAVFPAALLAALLAAAAPASAQSVRGRVLDEAAGLAIEGAHVVLRAAGGAIVAQDTTDAAGSFLLAAARPGGYTLTAGHPAYTSMAATPVRIGDREQVVVDIRLARAAVTLEPLTVTGRRRDPLHEATFEGALARRAAFPEFGPRRVLLKTDPELTSSLKVSDVVTFMPPTRGCLIVYSNGNLVGTQEGVEDLLEGSAFRLEAFEFYRTYADAPAGMRFAPVYALSPNQCSVLALWPDRGPGRGRTLLRAAIAAALVGALVVLGGML
jgi:hypothetical protein